MPKSSVKPKAKPAATWRAWTTRDQEQNPKRKCSVAGCREAPVRAKKTKTASGRERTHVYCATHAQENGG